VGWTPWGISLPSAGQNEFLINEKWGEELKLYEK
jgi:hypothetical protein